MNILEINEKMSHGDIFMLWGFDLFIDEHLLAYILIFRQFCFCYFRHFI